MADSGDTVVLLLKSKNEDDQYEKTLRAHGYEPVFIPVLSYEFTNEDILTEKLKNPNEFCGLIFTSQRAVDAVHNCITDVKFEDNWRSSLQEEWKSKPVFVTGKATGQSVCEKLQFFNILGEQSGSGQALAKVILEIIPQNSEKTLLFPCANIKKETLPNMLQEAGRKLCCVTVYSTKPDNNLRKNLEIHFSKQTKKRPCCIIFFSPSGVSFSNEVLKETFPVFDYIKFIAIGQSTEKGLIDHGLKVSGVAHKPEPISLATAVGDSLKELK